MDSHTLELLDFDKIRTLVAARAACSLGKTAALPHRAQPRPRRDPRPPGLTTEMAEALGAGLETAVRRSARHSPSRAAERRGRRRARAEALAETVETLRAIGNLDRWLARVGESVPASRAASAQGVGEFSGVARAIEGCLDNRGTVLDTASRRLSALRREIGRAQGANPGHASADASLSRDRSESSASPTSRWSAIITSCPSPRTSAARSRARSSAPARATRRSTSSPPQSASSPPSSRSFAPREAKEVRRILRWLSAQVGLVAEPLLATLETMAELDLIFARARLSLDYRMSAPHFNQEGSLVLRAARHPLLEALFRSDPALSSPHHPSPSRRRRRARPRKRPPRTIARPTASRGRPSDSPCDSSPSPRTVVPIDFNLGVRFRILVVTGPNTGGKTVALKTVGLLAIMAQSGLHVPAGEGSQFPIFDDVLADIGDEQSLEQSLSTFSSHVRRISEILGKATSSSLVLLDELGAGTDPTDGAALGRAILDELDRIGCRAIVTTHIGDLKTYALSNPDAENAAVEFDDETLRPEVSTA